jgi:diguanylate cyclase (GGDEF)-like protein/PAS domain S-box-containing protein
MSDGRNDAVTGNDSDREGAKASLGWRAWAWLLYVSLGVLATGVYFLLPSLAAQNVFFNLVGVTAVAVIVMGVLLHRPSYPTTWWLLALGLFLFVLGDTIWTVYENALRVEVPFPSVADLFYIGGYPVLAVGLLLIQERGIGRNVSSLINALIVATGAGMLSWVFLMAPYAHDPSLPFLERLLSIAYPLMDVFLLMVLVRLLLVPGGRQVAFNLLGVGLVFLLVADTVYVTTAQAGTYETGDPADAGWLLSYVLFGMAALHPSMTTLSEPVPDHKTRPTWWRLVLVLGASLMVPGSLVLQSTLGDHIDVHVIVGGAVVLFLLMTARVAIMIKERERTERALRESEERFRALIQNSSDILMLLDVDGTIRYESPSIERILGYRPEELVGKNAFDYVHPEDLREVLEAFVEGLANSELQPSAEYRFRHKDGSWCYLESVGSNLLDDTKVGGFVLNSRNITERKALEGELRHRALHDLLTDLPNRQLLMDRLGHTLKRIKRRGGRKVAVLFVDLNNFKFVNDSLGHELGDTLLVTVAERLKGCLRPEATLARFGGDEFIVLLEGVESPEDTVRVAERIIEELREPFVLDGRELFVTASVGIALGSGRERPEDLVRDADTAMYRAKEEDLAYQVFDPAMYEQVLRRLELENDIQRAIQADEFVLHYQPIVNLQSGEVWGVEALVRWNHPKRGLLDPSEFVAVAEESGLLNPVGNWVLEEACRRLKEWQDEHPRIPPLAVSVNLSVKQLQRPDLAESVRGVLRRTGLAAHFLSLDITETHYIKALKENTAALNRLRKLGIRIAIDDFGVGYSSFSYLKQLSADTLKIDKSFIERLGESLEDTAIVRMIIELAHTLEMQVVAEGVESAEQANQLKGMGCDLAQGFYLAEPLAPQTLPTYLA